MEPCVVVFTNFPDHETAARAARSLVEQRLAACANVLAGCKSVYWWLGAVESADEVPVLIKTRLDRYPELEQAIRRLHPYALPEIVALPIERGLPAYLEWVAAETVPPAPAGAGQPR